MIYYNENGASQEDKVFEVGFYKTTSTNIQTGEQKKLWSFSRIVTKRERTWKILWMQYQGEGALEERFH